MPNITLRLLQSSKPKSKVYFIRDNKVRGFAVNVNPTGRIKYLAEVRYKGRTVRRTIGEYPFMTLPKARKEAIVFIQLVRSGQYRKDSLEDLTLDELFNRYTATVSLKPNTQINYHQVIHFYLQDWLNKRVSSITKEMVEKRFYLIRDKGIAGGKPTYSQATKTMRILSALMNYARADDLIESNPVEVLKLKRIDRSLRKREHYLKAEEVKLLLSETAQDAHPMTLAIHLMLYTGLRKNEALRLKWDDLEVVDTVECILMSAAF